MRRAAARLVPVLLLTLAPLLLIGPARADTAPAVGDHVQVTNKGGQTFDAVVTAVNGTSVDYDYIGADGKPGHDGQADGTDDNGDHLIDRVQGSVSNAPNQSECGVGDVGCALGDAAKGAANDALRAIADAITTAIGNVVKTLGTLWVSIGTPQLAAGSVAEWLRGELAFYTGIAAVIATIIGAARMAIEHRAQPGKDLGAALVRLVIVNGASLAIIATAVAASDAFATWIIDQSTGGTDFGANMTGLLAMSSVTGIGVIIVILLGLAALFASLLQIILMIARGGLLVIVSGVLPLAASFTNIPAGRSWYQKLIGWTTAAVLYKAAAAIVYAVAFRLVGQHLFGTDGLISVLTGLMLMVMALFALPALMRLAVPLVQTAAHGGGGAGAGAVAGGLVATGAQIIQLRGNGGPGGGNGGQVSGWQPPPPGPTGAPTGTGKVASNGHGPTGATGAPAAATAGGAGGAGTAGASGAAGAAGAAGPAVAAAVQTAGAVVGSVRGTATKAADPGGADT